jgi:hypothetical protein
MSSTQLIGGSNTSCGAGQQWSNWRNYLAGPESLHPDGPVYVQLSTE